METKTQIERSRLEKHKLLDDPFYSEGMSPLVKVILGIMVDEIAQLQTELASRLDI